MKTHAVPQEIMSVEFKLFGNFLSLREFIFIAVGLALAWFFYFLMNKGIIPPLLAWPIILIIGGGGILMGLVPIQDRPLDQWITSFFTAINRPTQRVWKKTDLEPIQSQAGTTIVQKDHIVTPPTQTTDLISTAVTKKPKTEDPLDQTEAQELSRLKTTIQNLEKKIEEREKTVKQASSASQKTSTLPKSQPRSAPQNTINSASTTQTAHNSAANNPHQAVSQPKTQVQQPNQNVPKQNTPISQSPTIDPTYQPHQPTQQEPSKPAQTPIPKQVPQSQAQQQTPSVQPKEDTQQQQNQPSSIVISNNNINEYKTELPGIQLNPNTINIVVKDNAGQHIPQVTCIIKNNQGDPVRAAISNALGQIINNVPLKEGTYTVQLSKNGFVFPNVTVTLAGNAYPAIEIKSL